MEINPVKIFLQNGNKSSKIFFKMEINPVKIIL